MRSPPPPTSERDGGGGSSRWVELVRARNDIDAHLLVGRLTEADIDSRTVKDRSSPGAWLYGGSNPWAPVTILVRRFQLDAARLLLAEVAFAAPAAEPGPARARRGPSTRTLWWVTALALGLLLTALALAQVAGPASPCLVREFCNDSAGRGASGD